jgi:hypothetical protein
MAAATGRDPRQEIHRWLPDLHWLAICSQGARRVTTDATAGSTCLRAIRPRQSAQKSLAANPGLDSRWPGCESHYVKRTQKFSVASATVSRENREFSLCRSRPSTRHPARLGVSSAQALRGASIGDALSPRPFCSGFGRCASSPLAEIREREARRSMEQKMKKQKLTSSSPVSRVNARLNRFRNPCGEIKAVTFAVTFLAGLSAVFNPAFAQTQVIFHELYSTSSMSASVGNFLNTKNPRQRSLSTDRTQCSWVCWPFVV